MGCLGWVGVIRYSSSSLDLLNGVSRVALLALQLEPMFLFLLACLLTCLLARQTDSIELSGWENSLCTMQCIYSSVLCFGNTMTDCFLKQPISGF